MTRPRSLLIVLVVSVAAMAAMLLLASRGGHRSSRLRSNEPEPTSRRETTGSNATTPADAPAQHPRPPPGPVVSATSMGRRKKAVFREVSGDDMPERYREVRRDFFRSLESFRDEAGLTEAQWDRFLADLQESATMAGQLITDLGWNKIRQEDWDPMMTELDRELREKLAGYLTSAQMRRFRFRFGSQSLPARIASGNILQDPDDPDALAWDPNYFELAEPAEPGTAEAGNAP